MTAAAADFATGSAPPSSPEEPTELLQHTSRDNVQFKNWSDSPDGSSGSDSDSSVPDSESERKFEEGNFEEWSDDDSLSDSDENNSFICAEMSEKIYTGAQITVFESALCLIKFFLIFKVSYNCMNKIIQMIDLHLPKNNKMIKSMHMLKKYFSMDSLFKVIHKFCPKCKYLVENNISCGKCGETKLDTFVSYNLAKQIQKFFDRKDFEHQLTSRFHRNTEVGHLRHITDGKIHKLAQKTMASIYDFTLTLYTDGTQLFKSCKITTWPLLFTINELPTTCRYLAQNILFAGFWHSRVKPDFNLFLKPIAQQLETLYKGLKIRLYNGTETIIKPFLLAFTADKPAKASVLNMVGHNGKYACSKCLTRGKSIRVKNKKGIIRKKFSWHHTGSLVARTHVSAINHSRQGTPLNPFYGYKGESIFFSLLPDGIAGVSEDVMHGVYGGIGGKKMTEFYFGFAFKDMAYSLYNKLDSIISRMEKIRPPNFIRRRLRPLNQLSYYKTSEYKNWLLYYSVPLLHDLLPAKFFDHYFKLVHAIYLLNLNSISKDQIQLATKLLDEYTSDYGALYGNHLKVPNFHSLYHLAESVTNLGPLYEMSCFALESLLGLMKHFILGSNSPETKVSDVFSLIQNLPKITESLPKDSPVAVFLHGLQLGSVKRTEIFNGIYACGTLKNESIISYFIGSALRDSHMIDDSSPVSKVWTFSRLKTEKCEVVGFSGKGSNLYDSSLVYTKNNDLFRVHSFVKYKTCVCDTLCDCEACYYAVGYFCNVMFNERIPDNPFINQIFINDQAPVSVNILDIVDLCALISVKNTSGILLHFGCKRVNYVEME